MKNRRTLPPILVTVALFASPILSSQAEPGVPTDDSDGPSQATPAPAPTETPAPVKASAPNVYPPPAPELSPAPEPEPKVEAAPTPVPNVTTETSAPTALAEPPTPSRQIDAPSPAAATTYTAVKGDSLASIADQFGCSVAELKKANHLKKRTVKTGQVLVIPSKTAVAKSKSKSAKSVATTASAKKPSHHLAPAYAQAQPVQDFDVPASTFASCPPPPGNPDADPDMPTTSAPVAKLVSPGELTTSEESNQSDVVAPAPPVKKAPTVTPLSNIYPAPKKLAIMSAPSPTLTVPRKPAPSSLPPAPDGLAANPTGLPSQDSDFSAQTNPSRDFVGSSSKSSNRGFFGLFSSSPSEASSGDWGPRFIEQARILGDRGIAYDESWCPPGESHSWVMDCSNTSRYLYKTVAGLNLPRTASDQYYYLHLQNKAWDVPQASNGYADCNYLRRNLKAGDLLFWENTYRPERQPPITHVMIFLGTNAKGEWIMAGSQSTRGGEHNRRRGGPDIYVFDPTKACGGYTTWLGFVHHRGRFCAYGRPLEADPSKLAVATND